MKQSKPSPMRLAVGACSLVLMLSGAHAGLAQQGASNHSVANQPAITATGATAYPGPSSTARQEEQRATPGKAGGEGIKIHGHWVMDLKNADGKVVDHRDFENSLVAVGAAPSGDQIIAALLSGNVVPDTPAIGLVENYGNVTIADQSSYCNPSTNPTGLSCYIFYSGSSNLWGIGYYSAKSEAGLTAQVNFMPTVSLVLSGNYTVPQNLTSIAYVQTLYGMCAPASATYFPDPAMTLGGAVFSGAATFQNADELPKACAPPISNENTGLAAFTSTSVPPLPMSVTPGQILSISVTITFS
jgi:hypothetical protein